MAPCERPPSNSMVSGCVRAQVSSTAAPSPLRSAIRRFKRADRQCQQRISRNTT